MQKKEQIMRTTNCTKKNINNTLSRAHENELTHPSFVRSIDPVMIADPGQGIKGSWGVRSLM